MSSIKSVRIVMKTEADGSESPIVIAEPEVKAKPPLSYEQRLKKMSNRQLAGEVRKGVQGKLSGYNSIAESVVMDVLLESFKRGMQPFVR